MSADDFGELDDIGFLREAELFRDMPESVIRTVMLQGQSSHYSANASVVRRGDPGDSLFVVKTGVVEVTNPADGTPLAYLGRGECFGELALLTHSDRKADVRVPQQAELLAISHELFHDLMQNHPGFGSQLSVILANRLVAILEDLPKTGKKELQGDLRYFDLATIIQTLISSNQTGSMTLSTGHDVVAELVFQNGNIYRARYAHRRGDEAIHQLFQSSPDGEFLFENRVENEDTSEPDPGITVPAMALMMDSIRLQDELKVLLSDLPSDTTLVTRNTPNLEWSDPEGQADAHHVWGYLHDPMTVAELMDRANSCRYHTARIITRLIQTEQIRPTT